MCYVFFSGILGDGSFQYLGHVLAQKYIKEIHARTDMLPTFRPDPEVVKLFNAKLN